MSNAERFIDIYNNIDKLLKSIDKEDYQSFSSKVRSSKNPIIRTFKDKLIDYGELRNAIVHNPRMGEKLIAEPLTEVVEDFERILDKLQNPKKVIQLFSFSVNGGKPDDKLDKILKDMNRRSFSQFPVFDSQGHVLELINTNTIARWLSANIVNDAIRVGNPKIQDLIAHIEFRKNYKFISKDADIYSAYSLFIRQIEEKNRNLDVLFITDSGRENERLLGLITIEDIAGQIQLHPTDL